MVQCISWGNSARTGDRSTTAVVLAILLTFVGVLGMTGCGSTQDLPSSWDNGTVTVDGNASEWGSGMTNLKDTKVFLGVRNDGDYLYLCLNSQDQQFRRQMIGLGLTVWFESKGGNKLGVLYPIGMMKQGGRPTFESGETEDPENRERIVEQALQDFEILGPGKDDRNLFSVVQSPGISMKVGGKQGQTVYELKVPLKRSSEHPYASRRRSRIDGEYRDRNGKARCGLTTRRDG